MTLRWKTVGVTGDLHGNVSITIVTDAARWEIPNRKVYMFKANACKILFRCPVLGLSYYLH